MPSYPSSRCLNLASSSLSSSSSSYSFFFVFRFLVFLFFFLGVSALILNRKSSLYIMLLHLKQVKVPASSNFKTSSLSYGSPQKGQFQTSFLEVNKLVQRLQTLILFKILVKIIEKS